MIFQGFQLPEIVSDLRLRLSLYWILKEDFCVISQKNLKAAILWDILASDFQLLLNSKSSKIRLIVF